MGSCWLKSDLGGIETYNSIIKLTAHERLKSDLGGIETLHDGWDLMVAHPLKSDLGGIETQYSIPAELIEALR